MTRKILNKSSPGDSTKFGADDIDQINKYLTGTDQSGTDAVDVNTTTKYRASKLQIANPDNTFATTLTNYALTANNTLNVSELIRNPEFRRVGGWVGGSATTGFGFAGGALTQTGASATPNITNTDGKYVTIATSATSNAQAGQRLTAAGAVMRALGARFKIKFRVNTTTNFRFFAGLFSSSTSFPTGEDPLNAASGIGIGMRATDSSFRYMRNAGSGSTTFSSHTGVGPGGIHTLEVRAPAGDTAWETALDGVAYTLWSSDPIPASTTALYPFVSIETTEGVAKNMDVFWWIAETSA